MGEMSGNERIGRRVFRYDTVGSTMDVAWQLADTGMKHGGAIVAKHQNAGRGRFARQWVSAIGDSLLVSVFVEPSPDTATVLSVMTALAVADCCREIAQVSPKFKWPNDVLADGRKIAGVLTEIRADTGGSVSAVIGVGLNVNLMFNDDIELSQTATSLAEQTGHHYEIDLVETSFLASLDVRYLQAQGDSQALMRDWAADLSTLGARVDVHQRNGTISGIAETVDPTGRLGVRLPTGELAFLSEGDVTLAG